MHLKLKMKNWSEKEKRWQNFSCLPHLELAQNSWTTHQMKHQEASSHLSSWVQGQHIPISCWHLSFHPGGPSITFITFLGPGTRLVQAPHSPVPQVSDTAHSFLRVRPWGDCSCFQDLSETHQVPNWVSRVRKTQISIRTKVYQHQSPHCEGDRKNPRLSWKAPDPGNTCRLWLHLLHKGGKGFSLPLTIDNNYMFFPCLPQHECKTF